jgi:hypothetical protein
MSRWYILDDDDTPIPSNITDYVEWEKANPERRIVKQDVVGDIHVSTVFLGLDHRWWSSDTPVLWETMIFEGKHDQYQERYTSYKDALEGHKKALNLVKNETEE